MPKISHVKSARKVQGLCDACGQFIDKGDAYKHFSFYRSAPKKRHEACPDWRPSEMTANDKLSTLYAHQEAASDELSQLNPEEGVADMVESIESVLSTFREGVEEVAEMYREMAQSIEDGFGHRTEQCEEAESNADELDSFAQEVEAWAAEDYEQGEGLVEWFDAQVESAQEVVGSSPL